PVRPGTDTASCRSRPCGTGSSRRPWSPRLPADGFCFLGEDFGSRYPVALEEHRVIEPAAKTAYVGVPGSRVHIDQRRLKVDSPEDAEILSVPSGHVQRLVGFCPVRRCAVA